MRENGRSQPVGLNNGSALILMLFSVLCLTVLAALSLLSANSQWNLAKRSADSVTAYYAADLEAGDIFEQIKQGNLNGVDSKTLSGAVYHSYCVKIDENQDLAVLLRESDGEFQILSWTVVQTGEWEADGSLPVWDGTLGE